MSVSLYLFFSYNVLQMNIFFWHLFSTIVQLNTNHVQREYACFLKKKKIIII